MAFRVLKVTRAAPTACACARRRGDSPGAPVRAALTVRACRRDADKCNRVCKGKSRTSRRNEHRVDNAVFTTDIVRRAMRQPMFAHVTYAMLGCPPAEIASLHHVHQLQGWIHQHELPCNLRSVQMRRVAQVFALFRAHRSPLARLRVRGAHTHLWSRPSTRTPSTPSTPSTCTSASCASSTAA